MSPCNIERTNLLNRSRTAPAWYHGGREGAYVGDRHPEEYVDDNPDAYEAVARECGNCGKVKKCLKKEYLRG